MAGSRKWRVIPHWGTGAPIRLKHGQSHTWTWLKWHGLRARCRKLQEPLYGPWADYVVFRRDMGKAPTGASPARLDASKPWGPGNAVWK